MGGAWVGQSAAWSLHPAFLFHPELCLQRRQLPHTQQGEGQSPWVAAVGGGPTSPTTATDSEPLVLSPGVGAVWKTSPKGQSLWVQAAAQVVLLRETALGRGRDWLPPSYRSALSPWPTFIASVRVSVAGPTHASLCVSAVPTEARGICQPGLPRPGRRAVQFPLQLGGSPVGQYWCSSGLEGRPSFWYEEG